MLVVGFEFTILNLSLLTNDHHGLRIFGPDYIQIASKKIDFFHAYYMFDKMPQRMVKLFLKIRHDIDPNSSSYAVFHVF